MRNRVGGDGGEILIAGGYGLVVTKLFALHSYGCHIRVTEEAWQRCSQCRTMVELQYGCNHIT